MTETTSIKRKWKRRKRYIKRKWATNGEGQKEGRREEEKKLKKLQVVKIKKTALRCIQECLLSAAKVI
jgi:hypothetical protein